LAHDSLRLELRNTWFREQPDGVRAVMLAGTAASISESVDDRIKLVSAREPLSSRVFDPCSTQSASLSLPFKRHMYFALQRIRKLPSGRKVRVVPYDPSHEKPFA